VLAPLDMRLFGARLMAATPVGPGQDVLGGRGWLPDQGEEEAAHLGHRQRQQARKFRERYALALACSFCVLRPPLGLCCPGWAR